MSYTDRDIPSVDLLIDGHTATFSVGDTVRLSCVYQEFSGYLFSISRFSNDLLIDGCYSIYMRETPCSGLLSGGSTLVANLKMLGKTKQAPIISFGGDLRVHVEDLVQIHPLEQLAQVGEE